MKQVTRQSAAAANIELAIDRIVFDGVALSHSEQRHMAQALQDELSRLLGNATVSLAGGATPRLLAAPVSLGATVQAADLGRQIAQSVHQSMLQNNLG